MGSPPARRADTAGRASKTSRLVLSLFYLLLLAAAARGADPAPGDAADADPPARSVGEVTVTATRAERDVLEVPGNVTVLDREDIDRSGVDTVPELLRRQAGLFVTSTTTNPAGVQVEARGFNNGGSLGSGLLVQVDGRRANQADTGNTDWAVIPLDDVESIEIVRGPASALYGDNAVGGVINIRTRPAEGPLRATLRGRFGRYDSGGGSLGAAATVGSVTGSFFVDGYDTDGYRDRSDFDSQDYKGTLQATLGERVSVGASGGYHHDDRSFPGTLTRLEIGTLGRRASQPNVESDQAEVDAGFVEGWLEAFLTDDVELRIEPYHRDRNDDATITSIVFGETGIETDKGSTGVDAQLRIDRSLGKLRNRLIFGAEFLHEDTDRTIDFATETSVTDAERDIASAFLQNELNLTESLLLSSGIRFDHAKLDLRVKELVSGRSARDSPDLDVWSPKAALTWRVLPTLSVYASYARGFRLPNFDEDGPILSFPPGSPPTLPDLDEQISDAVEIGGSLRGERVSGNLALYWMRVRNEIIFDPFTFENSNFDRVRHRGIESSLSIRLLEWLTLHGTYSLEEVEIRKADDPIVEGRQMPITPKHRGTVGAYALLPHGFELGANLNVVGSRILANDFDRQLDKLDSYATLDLFLSFRPQLGEHFEGALTFAVRNATNESYNDFGARFDFDRNTLAAVPTAYFNPAVKRTWEVGLVVTVRR